MASCNVGYFLRLQLVSCCCCFCLVYFDKREIFIIISNPGHSFTLVTYLAPYHALCSQILHYLTTKKLHEQQKASYSGNEVWLDP